MTPSAIRAAVEALEAMCQNFPTDIDMDAAGWATHEINAACDAYDKGRAALSLLREAGEREPVAVVGADYTLLWAGGGPIAPIVERHGLRVGSKLYASVGDVQVDARPTPAHTCAMAGTQGGACEKHCGDKVRCWGNTP